MPSYASIAATGKSIERLLNARFADDPPIPSAIATTTATLARTEDFTAGLSDSQIKPPGLSIYLYRIETNKVMRAAWSGAGSVDGRAHLPLDLHYLLTAWAENAEYEHRIIGKALEVLEETPVLSGPLLHPDADWGPGEALQLIAADIDADAITRLFDSFDSDFRLSVAYVARIARIDGARVAASGRVAKATAEMGA